MAVSSSASSTVAPRSTHVSEPALQPFLQPTFDPAEFLNTALPALSLSTVSARASKNAVPLADLSSQTQDLLSQLNAHTTRLSTVLTQLTDDILRSGARLAYEVEVLRGEAIGLTESLTEGLKPDVENFLPEGITIPASEPSSDDAKADTTKNEKDDGANNPTPEAALSTTEAEKQTPIPGTEEPQTIEEKEPAYITQLRTLTLVRSRLESVQKVFGDAMHWTLAPSELSLASSLINISAPSPTSESQSREEKGKEFAEHLRAEIAELIITGGETEGEGEKGGGEQQGKDAAMLRIRALRDLAQVWKGTAEEKARARFVEGLVRMVEERQRQLDAERKKQRPGRSASAARPLPPPQQPPSTSSQKSGGGAGGFLENLARIRGNIYLD